MYKMMIVDDEQEVRQGIIKKIDWQHYHFEVVGEAENGIEALDVIEDNVPDVVITDISMPLMDGLALTATIRDRYPTVRVVILTGFDDFKFAQQAIRYGVSDYILKPVLPKDIGELMDKLKKEIDEEIADKEDREKLQRHYRDSMPILKDSFLTSMILDTPDINEIEKKVSFFDMNLRGNSFACAVISLDAESVGEELNNETDIELMKFAVTNITQEILDRHCLGEAFLYDNMTVVVSGLESDERVTVCNKLISVLEEIRQNVEKYLKLTVTVGLGSIYGRLDRAKESYRYAVTALEYKLVMGSNKVIFLDDIEPESTDMVLFDENKERTLISSIKFGKERDVLQAVEGLFDHLSGVKASIKEYYLYFMEIISAMSKLARTFEVDAVNVLRDNYGIDQLIREFNTMDEVKEWLTRLCLELQEQVSSKRLNATQVLLEKAKDYIEKHYADHELSVQKLADHLYISSSYLSLIFKKEANQTFLKHLIEVRLTAAKELLSDPNIKVTEVAERVGYPDVSYFSYFFKKNFGVSPREYRNKVGKAI